jgi:DNA polymerase III alpha subunit
MRIDTFGQKIYTENDLCEIYLINPERTLRNVLTETEIKFDPALELTNVPKTIKYVPFEGSVDEFDKHFQETWFIPDAYKNFDIAEYVLSLCKTDAEIQRVGQELLMYQDRNMFGLLIYLKYLVDTMRKNKVVWGVGRGSSCASYVLYLMGVHRINSLYYDLPIEEFLK